MTKRVVLWGSLCLAVAPWVGLAAFFSLHMGAGAGGFVTSMVLIPAYGVEAARDVIQPDRHFGGLEDGPALAVLRTSFGHGIRPSDGRLLYDLIVTNGYRCALDVGTAGGYSSMWFALAMQKTGGTVAAHNALFFAPEQPEYLSAIRNAANLDTNIARAVSGGISISIKCPGASADGR